MNILHLISSSGLYGAESMMLSLCTELTRQRCEPVVGVFRNLHKPNLDILDKAKKLGLRTVMFDCHQRIDLGTVKAIRAFISANSIAILHTHGYKADIYGYLAAKKLGTVIVATCHSLIEHQYNTALSLQLYGLLDRKVLRNVDMVISVSEPIGYRLHENGIAAEKIRVIPNGVDIDLFSRARPGFRAELGAGDRLIVGMIGRLATAKGPDVFLRAAEGVLREFPETLFVLVGDGPDRERLRKVARSLSRMTNVIFAGRHDDMPSVHASLDILVLPSLSEGMPMVILEAMAAGKAIIASEVGGIPSLVIPGETGLLVKPGDSNILQTAIIKLLAEPGLRRRLGDSAQELARKRYSSRIMSENYLSTYHQATSKVDLGRFSESEAKA